MKSKRSTPIISTYVLSLLVAVALLVMWVVYAVRSGSRLEALASRIGSYDGEGVHWVLLTVGCVLLALLIAGLTYQLALALAARRYSRKQEEFVSHVTHELKSPLAAIKLQAQTLQAIEPTAAQREHSLGLILTEAERMARLIDNVLESSRMVARKASLELTAVELGPFLDDYFARARHRVEQQGVRLTVLGRSRAVVKADPEALERVLDNLLDNAASFSDRGGEVRCRITDGTDRVLLEVEDDGIGIPKRELGKIFDRFYQIGREIRGRRRGTGLGLAIVSGLVREMKGSVQAFSQEGRPGTRFEVRLQPWSREA